MKKIFSILFVFLVTYFFIACDKDETNDPNTLGGDTKTEISNVGDEFGLGVKVGDTYVNINESIKVTSNNNGLVTLKVKANVSQVPKLKSLVDKIPIDIYDSQGNIDIDVQFKITTEGIQDFFNKDAKPHTMIKYSSNPGDKYELKKTDGKTITRTVTAKSDVDDFPYGFIDIKTTTVEQDSRIPGVNKFVYRANHKFGIVYFEAYLEDGTKLSSYVYSPAY